MKLLSMDEAKREDDDGGKCQVVRLVPYVHQVGGHQCVMTYDETTICKPLEERELEFYRSLPDSLRPFTPEFKGVIDVHFEKDDQGMLQCYAVPDRCVCNAKCDLTEYQSDDESRDRTFSFQDVNSKDNTEDGLLWTDAMKERLMMILRNKRRGSISKFLLLGNIAAKLSHPCVLDLKMGTRQYGDHESREKIQRRTKVCAESTSRTLGVRVCGMQVFNHQSNSYDFVDKYVGRQLDNKGFEDAIKKFFNNGLVVLHDVIDPLLQKLVALHDVVTQADCYRFYSCSLLLIYNSNPEETEVSRTESVDVRMIDFAKVCQKGDETNKHKGPDCGLLKGLETMVRVLRSLLEER